MVSMKASAGWFALFTLAWLAIWTVQLTPVQLLLPDQLDTPGTAGTWVYGVVYSGIVLGVGGLAGVIAGPLSGALSDRTRTRWGRRRPWAVGASWLTAVCLLLTGMAQGPWAIGVAWTGVSIGIAVASAAFTALIADQLPERQRGSAAAAASSSQALGIVLGVGVVVLLGLCVFAGYLTLAVSSPWSAPPPRSCCPTRSRMLRGIRYASDGRCPGRRCATATSRGWYGAGSSSTSATRCLRRCSCSS
jgi:MFS family permease